MKQKTERRGHYANTAWGAGLRTGLHNPGHHSPDGLCRCPVQSRPVNINNDRRHPEPCDVVPHATVKVAARKIDKVYRAVGWNGGYTRSGI